MQKQTDPYELYAMSLVPDFRRLPAQKFALLKAKLAALMVEIEFSDVATGASNFGAPLSRPMSAFDGSSFGLQHLQPPLHSSSFGMPTMQLPQQSAPDHIRNPWYGFQSYPSVQRPSEPWLSTSYPSPSQHVWGPSAPTATCIASTQESMASCIGSSIAGTTAADSEDAADD